MRADPQGIEPHLAGCLLLASRGNGSQGIAVRSAGNSSHADQIKLIHPAVRNAPIAELAYRIFPTVSIERQGKGVAFLIFKVNAKCLFGAHFQLLRGCFVSLEQLYTMRYTRSTYIYSSVIPSRARNSSSV